MPMKVKTDRNVRCCGCSFTEPVTSLTLAQPSHTLKERIHAADRHAARIIYRHMKETGHSLVDQTLYMPRRSIDAPKK